MISPDATAKPERSYYIRWLVLISLLGFLIRIWNLETSSFDYDEAYEILHAETQISVLVNKQDGFPPLYRWLMGNLYAFSGDDQIFRWFSALTGSMTIVAVGLLGRRIAGASSGLLAALFFALSANHVLISQLGRGYSLYVLFTTLTLLFAWRLREQSTKKDWLGFLVCAWLSIATHYFAGILLLLLGILLLLENYFVSENRQPAWKSTLLAAIALILCCLPLIDCLKADLGLSDEFHHKVQFDIEAYAFSYYRLFSGNTLGPSVTELRELEAGPAVKAIFPWALALFLPAALLFGSAWKRLNTGNRNWLMVLLLAPPPMIFLAAQIAPTGYNDRYMAWMIVPWMITLGCGAAFDRQRPWVTASTATLLTFGLFAISNRHLDPRYAEQDFRAVVELIDQESNASDLSPAVLAAPRYFGEAVLYALPKDWLGQNLTATPNREQDWGVVLPRFRSLIGARNEAWLVTPWYPESDPRHALCEELITRLEAKLASRVTPTLMLYRLPTASIK